MKHYVNSDTLDEKYTFISNESAQFDIVSVLLNVIFKHNLKKLLNSLDFFLFNVRCTKTIMKTF